MHIESGNIRIRRIPLNWVVELKKNGTSKKGEPIITWTVDGYYTNLEHIAEAVLNLMITDTPEGEAIAEQITALIADVEAAKVEFLAGLRAVE